MKRLMELKVFKKGKREVYVDFVNGLVKWGKMDYKLSYIEVNGKKYPYVVIEDIKPLSKIRPIIKSVNENKRELKYCEYESTGNTYYVTGIGGKSIKAYKNNNVQEEYFFYNTTEGQRLLNELLSSLENQTVL